MQSRTRALSEVAAGPSDLTSAAGFFRWACSLHAHKCGVRGSKLHISQAYRVFLLCFKDCERVGRDKAWNPQGKRRDPSQSVPVAVVHECAAQSRHAPNAEPKAPPRAPTAGVGSSFADIRNQAFDAPDALAGARRQEPASRIMNNF